MAPSCRVCNCEFALSNRGIWKALCLECSDERDARSKAKINSLSQEVTSLRFDQSTPLQAKPDEMQQRLEAKDRKIKEQESRIKSLEKKIERIRGEAVPGMFMGGSFEEVAGYHMMLEDRAEEIEGLEEALEDCLSEKRELEDTVSGLREFHTELESHLASLRKKQSDEEKRLNGEIERLRKDHSAQAEAFKAENARLSQRIQELEKSLASKDKKLAFREAELREYWENKLEVKDSCRKREITALNNSSKRKSARIRDLEGDVAEMQEKQESLQREVEREIFVNVYADMMRGRERAQEEERELERQRERKQEKDREAELLDRIQRLEMYGRHKVEQGQERERQLSEALKAAEEHRKTCPARTNGLMLKGSVYADVTLRAGGKQVKAHRAVLAAGSPALATMLRSVETGFQGTMALDIKDMSGDGLMQFLHFIYTGCLQPSPFVTKAVGQELLAAADKYHIPELHNVVSGGVMK